MCKIMGGNPVFRGTRVPVHMLAELVPSTRARARVAGVEVWSGRSGQAERLGGLQIDDQLERRRLLHRQIGRLLPSEDSSGINAGLPNPAGDARSIADQAAGQQNRV